mgnify:CR=1 FL=1
MQVSGRIRAEDTVVIRSGYDGEIFVNVHNVGKETQTVFPCDRIAQAVLLPVVHFRALETHEDNLYNWYPITISDRGAGVARSVRRGIGVVGCWYCEARGTGGAGCAIGRLSWHAQSLARRGEAARRRALALDSAVANTPLA